MMNDKNEVNANQQQQQPGKEKDTHERKKKTLEHTDRAKNNKNKWIICTRAKPTSHRRHRYRCCCIVPFVLEIEILLRKA